MDRLGFGFDASSWKEGGAAQSLAKYGLDFVTDTYLPEKLQQKLGLQSAKLQIRVCCDWCMARVSYPVIALIASFVCVASFAVSYSNFDGYGDLDPEQNSLQIMESGDSFSIMLDEYDRDSGLF